MYLRIESIVRTVGEDAPDTQSDQRRPLPLTASWITVDGARPRDRA